MHWENIDKSRQDGAHYSVMRQTKFSEGMDSLREMFPNAVANDMNFVLFSTSGVHGTYNTIESAESYLGGEEEGCGEVTFLIVHPRLVAVRYGTCNPRNQADIDYLKALRSSSHEAIASIGMP